MAWDESVALATGLSGKGYISWAAGYPAAIVHVTAYPDWIGAVDGDPERLIGLGLLNWGTQGYTRPGTHLQYEYLELPGADAAVDRFHYTLPPGVTINVTAVRMKAEVQPLDRAFTLQFSNYDGTVGPHSLTSRIDYTVPSGKRMFVDSVDLNATRITAGSASGQFYAVCHPSSLGDLVAVHALDNTIGARISKSIAPGVLLEAGEEILIRTADASTGGTIRFILCLAGRLYTLP